MAVWGCVQQGCLVAERSGPESAMLDGGCVSRVVLCAQAGGVWGWDLRAMAARRLWCLWVLECSPPFLPALGMCQQAACLLEDGGGAITFRSALWECTLIC